MTMFRTNINALKPSPMRGVLDALWPIAAGIVAGLFMYLALGPLVGGYASNLLMVIAINILLATSLTVVNGFTGQFSIGHGAFMGVGAYVGGTTVYYASLLIFKNADASGGLLSNTLSGSLVGPLVSTGDLIFLVSVVAAALAAALAGFVVGLPSLRLKGDYLAIVTLGFGEILRVLLQGTPEQIMPWKAAEAASVPVYELVYKVGGSQGLKFIPSYTSLFWAYFFVAVCLILMLRLKTSSMGRTFLSIREDEVAAQAMGVHVTRVKVRAFVLSSAFAGVAGALYAMQTGTLVPQDFGYQRSFEVLILVVLGGLGSISGAALAAVLLTILPEVLRDPSALVGVWPWIVGVAVLSASAGVWLLVIAKKQKRVRQLPFALIGLGIGLLVFLGICQVATWQGWNLGKYRLIVYALALILMLMLRPKGLLGVCELWDKALWHELFGKMRLKGDAGKGDAGKGDQAKGNLASASDKGGA